MSTYESNTGNPSLPVAKPLSRSYPAVTHRAPPDSTPIDRAALLLDGFLVTGKDANAHPSVADFTGAKAAVTRHLHDRIDDIQALTYDQFLAATKRGHAVIMHDMVESSVSGIVAGAWPDADAPTRAAAGETIQAIIKDHAQMPDWDKRDSILARVRMQMRRALRPLGCPQQEQDRISDRVSRLIVAGLYQPEST